MSVFRLYRIVYFYCFFLEFNLFVAAGMKANIRKIKHGRRERKVYWRANTIEEEGGRRKEEGGRRRGKRVRPLQFSPQSL
jgi:hypothetical protein